MQTFTKDLGKQMLQLCPHWEAVACDKNGECYWYKKVPEKDKHYGVWYQKPGDICEGSMFIGNYNCPDWENSLVTRED